jgi:ATP-dependent DNA ligase
MRLIRRKTPPPPPSNSDDWRPQRYGGNYRSIRDAIVEPGWQGVRVLVRHDGTTTRLADEGGIDCTAEFALVDEAIAAAARADDFIVDGFLTVEATQETAGKLLAEIKPPSGGQIMTQWVLGSRAAQPSIERRKLDPGRPIAFVAIDILRVDGSSLLDIPLLERKRLLEGSLAQSDLVRITPFVRPPIGNFLATWRGMGFVELAYKGANSRYTPDLRSGEWATVPMPMK